MTELELPDGTIIEFPDGTSPDKMRDVARRSMGVDSQAPASPTPAPAAPEPAPNRLEGAAEAIVNDLGGGMQGVNPVALSEKRGSAVGVLKTLPGSDMQVVDVDGTIEPVENYPPDRFVTRQEGGTTYIYPRTPDVEENPLASAGRLLGYGAVEQFGNIAKAAKPVDEAAEAVGVTPSFAMRGTVPAKIAAAGEQYLPTAGRFKDDAARVTDEIAAAAGRIADKAGPGVTPVDAGEALQRGGEAFRTGVQNRTTALYGAVDKAIPPGTKMAAPQTMAVIEKEAGKLRSLPNTISAKRLEALRSGEMTWEQARALRTDIGTALRSFDGAETNVAKGQLDQIYKALSEDLDAAVKQAGPAAVEAWNRANTYTRVSKERIDKAFGRILGDKVSPEQAYSAVIGMAQEGTSRSNIGSLSRLFKSLPEEEAATVAGTVIRRLGKATAGAQDAAGDVFSAETFLTNWNKMSPEARGIIGRAGLDKGVPEELSKLALVIERAKEAGKVRNTSNTGIAVTSGLLGAGASMAPVTTGVVYALSHLSARAMTNVGFLRKLNAYAAHGNSGPLFTLAKSKSPLALDAATVLRLSAQSSQSPALAAP